VAKLARQVQQGAAESGGGGSGGLPAWLSPEALVADVQLSQVRAATRCMLEALAAAAAEHQQLNLLQRVEAEAGVKVAAEASWPGSAASRSSSTAPQSRCSLAGSRPCSAAGSSAKVSVGKARGSLRPSSRAGSSCSGRSAHGGSPVKAPSLSTVQLQL
jgi:hypothetical protein